MTKEEKGLQVCELKDLEFPVELIENPANCNSEYSMIVQGYLGENQEAYHLNYCSSRYELVENTKIFPEIEKVLRTNKIAFEVTYKHVNHVRFYADYNITDERFKYKMKGTSDSIEPMLRVQHSYNGLTKYQITFGYYRFVCSNGLVVPVQEMKDYNLAITGKHTASIKGSFKKLEVMLNQFVNNKEIIQKITNNYELLGGVWIENPKERVEAILKATKISVAEKKVNDILERVRKEANNPHLGYDGLINDWLIYNGINGHLNDDKLNIAAPEKRMADDQKVFEFMIKEAQAAQNTMKVNVN